MFTPRKQQKPKPFFGTPLNLPSSPMLKKLGYGTGKMEKEISSAFHTLSAWEFRVYFCFCYKRNSSIPIWTTTRRSRKHKITVGTEMSVTQAQRRWGEQKCNIEAIAARSWYFEVCSGLSISYQRKGWHESPISFSDRWIIRTLSASVDWKSCKTAETHWWWKSAQHHWATC